MSSYSRPDVLRLAAASNCDPRTAEKWLRGESVVRAIATVLAAEAKKLGLQQPQPSPRKKRSA